MTTANVMERPAKSQAFMPSVALEIPPVAKQMRAACNGSAAYVFSSAARTRASRIRVPSSTMVIYLPWDEITDLLRVSPIQAPLQTKDMVGALRDRGLPMAALADIVDVERKTVYLWADGGIARPENHDRLVQVHSLLAGEQDGSLRFYHRFWDRKLPDGGTLREVLTAANLDLQRAHAALNFLRPHALGAMSRDVERRDHLASRPKPPASSMTLHLRAGT